MRQAAVCRRGNQTLIMCGAADGHHAPALTVMPISKDLLEILCCPRTKIPVEMLPEDRLARLNARVSEGAVKYYDDSPVEEPLQEGLITTDGKLIYRIDDEIPVMLVEKAIAADQSEG